MDLFPLRRIFVMDAIWWDPFPPAWDRVKLSENLDWTRLYWSTLWLHSCHCGIPAVQNYDHHAYWKRGVAVPPDFGSLEGSV